MSGRESRRLALVTGASSGIGREIARGLADRGCEVVAAGRDAGRLEALRAEYADGMVHALSVDLSGGASPLLDQLAAQGLDPEILVNGAGFGDISPFVASDLSKQLSMIQVNVGATVELTRALGERMALRGEGWILNVASTAAFVPGPLMATYYATKAFVLSFSLALRQELAPRGVSVSTLCPGPTRTGFDAAAGARSTGNSRRGMLEATAVARCAVRGLFAGRRLIVPGFANKTAVLLGRFVPPRALARYIERYNARK